MVQYAEHRYPCLDHYPAGKQYISDGQIKLAAQQRVKKKMSTLKSGKLSSARKKKLDRNAFKKLKAAFRVSAIWDPDTELGITFLDGTDKQKNWVKKVINEKLAPVCHRLTFIWDAPIEESDFRISFSLPGQAWSYVGTDCLDIPKPDPTMNLGWIDDDVQYDAEPYKNTGLVVLHEFCHALGMIHEHQNPKGNEIVWNKEVVYEELAQTNGWDPQQVDHNMFKKYGDKELCLEAQEAEPYEGQKLDIEGYCGGEEVNGSQYDIYSVMHYFYPATWILEGPTEIPVNTELSRLDKIWLGNYYGTPTSEEDELAAVEDETKAIESEILEDEIIADEDGDIIDEEVMMDDEMDEMGEYEMEEEMVETDDEEEIIDDVERVDKYPGFLTDDINTDIIILIVLLIILYIIMYYVFNSSKSFVPKPPRMSTPKPPRMSTPKPPRMSTPKPPRMSTPKLPRMSSDV
jgi:hypothetical protein